MESTPYLSSYHQRHSFARGMTRAGEGGERASAHREKAIAEIDGLFFGLNYIEKTNYMAHANDMMNDFNSDLDAQTFSGPDENMQMPQSTGEANNKSDNNSDAATSHQSQNSPSQSQYTHEPTIPSGYAWSSIRNVKEGSEKLWTKFDVVAEALNRGVINKIRKKYETAKGLREAGVFAFRNTAGGDAPRDLMQVFAFASLSYVISCILHEKKRIDKSEILADIHVWRDAIQDVEEREAFVQLAQNLWPESHDRFHFIPLNLPTRSVSTELPFTTESWTRNPNGQARAQAPVGDFQHEEVPQMRMDSLDGQSSMDFQVSTGLDPAAMELSNDAFLSQAQAYDAFEMGQFFLESHVCDLMTRTNQEYNWAALQGQSSTTRTTDSAGWAPDVPGQPPDDTSEHYRLLTSTFHGLTSNRYSGSGTAEPGGPSVAWDSPGLCDKLRATKAYQLIIIYFCQVGGLFYLLSGGGITAKTPQSVAAFNSQQEASKRIIQEQYLDLLANSDILVSSQALAILAIVKKFVKLGYLQDIREVQDYMLTVGKLLLHSCFPNFCRWVLYPDQATPSTTGDGLDSGYQMLASDDSATPPTHPASAVWICNKCGNIYSNSSNLSRHKRRHDPRRSLVCPVGCGYVERCGRLDKMRKHWARNHRDLDAPEFFMR